MISIFLLLSMLNMATVSLSKDKDNVVKPPALGEKSKEVKKVTDSSEKSHTSSDSKKENKDISKDSELSSQGMPKTLSTLGSDDGGNWVLKRAWLEKAERLFDEIVKINSQISQFQLQYFALRNEADKQIDEGKRNLKISLDDITKVASYLLATTKDSDLSGASVSEKSFYSTLVDNKSDLEQLQKDVVDLQKIDSDMDIVIERLIDQVNKCRDFETKSWSDFKQIGRVLSDDLAKKLFYKIEGYQKNMIASFDYLQDELHKYFDSLIKQSKNKINAINDKVNLLGKNGIKLSFELKKMTGGFEDSDSKKASKADLVPVDKSKDGAVVQLKEVGQMILDVILYVPRKVAGLFGVEF